MPINIFFKKTKEQLKGNHFKYSMVTLAIIFIAMLIPEIDFFNSIYLNIFADTVFSLIISAPMVLYTNIIDLNIVKNKENIFPNINKVLSRTLQSIIMILLISFATYIGFILLIIPGFFALVLCSQANYILADSEEKTAIEAIKESIKLMKGHIWDLIMLDIRLLVYIIPVLCMILLYLAHPIFMVFVMVFLNIYLLYIIPKIQVTRANFYMYLKELKSDI